MGSDHHRHADHDFHHHQRHIDHDTGADEAAGRETPVVTKTEGITEVPPEGAGAGAHDPGGAGQTGPSDGGGGAGAASPPAGPAAGAEEEEEEEELLEDAAKAANDIAIVLRRLVRGWVTRATLRIGSLTRLPHVSQ